MKSTQSECDRVFKVLEDCAAKGLRCPKNGEHGINHFIITDLALLGKIEAQVSGTNWRTVNILVGPHAGKSTQADPKWKGERSLHSKTDKNGTIHYRDGKPRTASQVPDFYPKRRSA